MLNVFEKKILEFIASEGLFEPGTKVLLAVSGGADSIAALEVMRSLKAAKFLDVDFVCAHINHQLRGKDADMDEAFVVEYGNKCDLRVITSRVDVRGYASVNKVSLETAGRKLRLESLATTARDNDIRFIVTGHHKNDNAETILQRLGRGTGFRGLAGIWPKRDFGDISFVRPLLSVTRKDIVQYLRQKKINWRTDHTNEDTGYRRNYIRHRLLPQLQRGNSVCLVEQLSVLSQCALGFYKVVCSTTDDVWNKAIKNDGDILRLDLAGFAGLHDAVKVELIRRAITCIGSGERDLTQEHYERILQLTEENVSGRKIELPGRFAVSREYDKLIFERTEVVKDIEKTQESVEIKIPGRTRWGNYLIETAVLDAGMFAIERFKAGKTSFTECFDADKIKPPIMIRFRKTGDRFIPLGLTDEKKVGKFLTDQRVVQRIRKKTLVITDSEKIIWLWPIRISEQAKVISKTRKILQLQITDAT